MTGQRITRTRIKGGRMKRRSSRWQGPRTLPTEELKPCPFCGSRNLLFYVADRSVYRVSCMDCAAKARYAYSHADAAANWNRRAE